MIEKLKFPSTMDATDIGLIEYAYSRMASAAGVDMPETYLFSARSRRRRRRHEEINEADRR